MKFQSMIILVLLALLSVGCDDDDLLEYPREFQFDRAASQSEQMYVVNSSNDLVPAELTGRYAGFADTVAQFIENEVLDFFLIEKISFLDASSAQARLIVDGDVMDEVSLSYVETAEEIVVGSQSDVKFQGSTSDERIERCMAVTAIGNGQSTPADLSVYGIEIGQCAGSIEDYRDQIAQYNLVQGDTVGIYFVDLLYRRK